jgi:hypothetical protein
MRYLHDPDGTRLPIKLDTTTNGEFAPIPLAPVHCQANRIALAAATANAQRLGLDRRSFLVSATGVATTLLAMNAAYARNGPPSGRGGYFELPDEAALELPVARSALDGNEFIFDVQGHFVNPTGAWTRRLPADARPLQMPKTQSCGPGKGPGRLDYLQCIGTDEFVKDVFLDSDTDLMVLSFVPSTRAGEPLTIEEAAATARIVEKLERRQRLYPTATSLRLVHAEGDGTIVALGGATQWTNKLLDNQANAGLATMLLAPAAGRHVVVLSGDGAGGEKGLFDLVPNRVWFAIGQIGMGFVVLALWRARRLGNPYLSLHIPDGLFPSHP